MKYPYYPTKLLALGCLVAAAATVRAQTAPAPSAAATAPASTTAIPTTTAAAPAKAADDSNGELVTLPAFSISEARDASYVGTSSLSSTRIAVDLL